LYHVIKRWRLLRLHHGTRAACRLFRPARVHG
jgi:hypothetical protein